MIITTDWARKIGFCNDPAEVHGWAAWWHLYLPRERFLTLHLGKSPDQRVPRLAAYWGP